MKSIAGKSAGVVVAGAIAFALLGGIGGYFLGRGDPGSAESADETPPPAVRDFRFDNPLGTAERDEWATYRLPDNKTLTYTVVGRNPDTGAVSIHEARRDDELDVLQVNQDHRLGPNYFLFGFEDFQVVRLYPERIRAAGRVFDCLCVETNSKRQGLVKSWFSNEVPALGLVKRERGGVGAHAGLLICEITDWSGRNSGR